MHRLKNLSSIHKQLTWQSGPNERFTIQSNNYFLRTLHIYMTGNLYTMENMNWLISTGSFVISLGNNSCEQFNNYGR